MGFKENIKQLREAKGWTQAEAALRVGVPFRSLQNWEAGSREPRLEALKKLAVAYGVPVDTLLTDQDEPAPKRGRPPKAAETAPKKPRKGK